MVSIFDSSITASTFADDAIAQLFSDRAEIRAMIRVESELALVQANLGIIPTGMGSKISQALESIDVDPAQLAAGYAKDGLCVPSLVKLLAEQLPDDAGDYLHWGATSQDIVDSGLLVRLKMICEILGTRIDKLIGLLRALTETHRSTVMLGRTRGQAALPTVFGLKTAGWLSPLVRQKQRLKELLPRLLVVQLGGAVGTLAPLGSQGLEVNQQLAAALDLNPSTMSWHTQRDNIVEFCNWLSVTAGAIGKIGNDLLLMAQSEVAEISFSNGGGSSTMPQKSNPVVADNLVALARYCAGEAGSMQNVLVQSHERDGSCMILESLLFPGLVCAGAASLALGIACIETVKVNESTMMDNLSATNGLVMAEAATFELSKVISKRQASQVVKEACKNAMKSGSNMIDELEKIADAEVDWQQLKQPENYLGVADQIIGEVLDSC